MTTPHQSNFWNSNIQEAVGLHVGAKEREEVTEPLEAHPRFVLTSEPQPNGFSAPPSSEKLVDDALNKNLEDLLSELSSSQRGVEPSEVVALLLWFAPFLKKAIFEAVELGMSLQETRAVKSLLPGPTSNGTQGFVEHQNGHSSLESGPSSQSPIPQAVADETARIHEGPSAEDNLEVVSPWLANGRVTVLVSPFKGFAEVQKFLRDLERVPGIYDVKPKRFSAGRLCMTLGTEHADINTLVDRLETELSPYRPTPCSVQNDFVELLLKPA